MMITHPMRFLCINAEIGLHFAAITKESPEFPLSSARPAWERIQRGLRGPAPFIVDSVVHPPPRTHKRKQSFVFGEWSRFTADGLPTKEQDSVTTGPGSAARSLTQCDLTLRFTQLLMQTQLQQPISIHAAAGLLLLVLLSVLTSP